MRFFTRPKHGKYICTDCLHDDMAQYKGSVFLSIILLLCFLLPGILYIIWSLVGGRMKCPSCKHLSMIPAHSQNGQKLLIQEYGEEIFEREKCIFPELTFGVFLLVIFLIYVSTVFVMVPVIDAVNVEHYKNKDDVENIAKAKQKNSLKQEFINKHDDLIILLQGANNYGEYKRALERTAKFLPVADADFIAVREAIEAKYAALEIQQKKEAKEQEAAEYIEKTKQQIVELPNLDFTPFLVSKDTIMLAVAAYVSGAEHIEKHKQYDLNAQQIDIVREYASLLRRMQKKDFPRFRDAYGPLARQALWSEDMSAKTYGKRYTTIDFVGGMFTQNKNIKTFYIGTYKVLQNLRFKKANFKWHKNYGEYSSYSLDSPDDQDLVIPEGFGEFRTVIIPSKKD